MFTGLVEEVGSIRSIVPESTGVRVTVQAEVVAGDAKIGDSIAVSGCCLTVVEVAGATFSAQAGTETLARTTLGGWQTGRRVNLERALSPTSRLGGHFVQGHVDGVGRGRSATPEGDTVRWRFSLPEGLDHLVVEKGSIAVDGISLTVTGESQGEFEVAVIPHTMAHTNLGTLRPGDGVNLEMDILAKYVHRMVTRMAGKKSGLTEDFLREQGFC